MRSKSSTKFVVYSILAITGALLIGFLIKSSIEQRRVNDRAIRQAKGCLEGAIVIPHGNNPAVQKTAAIMREFGAKSKKGDYFIDIVNVKVDINCECSNGRIIAFKRDGRTIGIVLYDNTYTSSLDGLEAGVARWAIKHKKEAKLWRARARSADGLSFQ